MSWKAGVDELRRRQAMTARMGGPDKVARHAASGKLTVRERIAALLDPSKLVRPEPARVQYRP